MFCTKFKLSADRIQTGLGLTLNCLWKYRVLQRYVGYIDIGIYNNIYQ